MHRQPRYINFDDERLIDFKLSDFDDILLVAEEMSSKQHYFYFDEIQNIDDWEKFAIRVANQGYKVDITGSNAKMLSKEVAAKLGGRYIILTNNSKAWCNPLEICHIKGVLGKFGKRLR